MFSNSIERRIYKGHHISIAEVYGAWIRFQLSAGNCPNKRLQELWEQYGEDAFELQVVKRLEYDDPKENHQEELETLCELCLLENPNARRFWK